jgi:hypothetical protein
MEGKNWGTELLDLVSSGVDIYGRYNAIGQADENREFQFDMAELQANQAVSLAEADAKNKRLAYLALGATAAVFLGIMLIKQMRKAKI